MTQALIEIQRVLSEANAAGKLTDTIWRGPAETLFDYIQNEIDATGTTGCTDQHQIAEPQKFTVDSEMSRAFEIEYGQDWKDPDWRRETGVWASAWHKATNAARATAPQAVQPAVPFMHGIADGCGNAYFEEGCVAPEARDLQPEVVGLNSCLDDGERPYSVVPLYTQPAAQGLDAPESEYQRGYRHGYNRRDAEVQGALL